MVPSNTDLLRLAPPSSGQAPSLGLHPGLKGVGGKPGPSRSWAATSPSPTSNLGAFVTSAPRPFSGLQGPLYPPARQPKAQGITNSTPAHAKRKPVPHVVERAECRRR